MNDTSTIGGAPSPSGISLKNAIIGGFIILVIGAAVGRFSLPAKVVTKTETKTVTQTVTKVVTKTVYQKAVVDDKNKVTTITTTVSPNGTKTTTTTITDKSIISSNTDKTAQSNSNTASNSSSDTVSTKTTTYSKNDWLVSGIAASRIPLSSGGSPIEYGAAVNRRILGPIYVGGFGLSGGTYGVSAGLSF